MAEIADFNQFAEAILDHGFGERWFRGQPKAGWKLLPAVLRADFAPSIDRNNLVEVERRINCDYRRQTASMSALPRTDADTYFQARHHGLPTRLLDWSTSAFVALFNAVAEDRRFKDDTGEVFILNPVAACEGIHDFDHIAEVDDPKFKTAVQALFSGREPFNHDAPVIPVAPPLYFGRMYQQGARFTFHAVKVLGMKQSGDPGKEVQPERTLLIPAHRKRYFRDILRVGGVSIAHLSPDPDHVVRQIVSELR